MMKKQLTSVLIKLSPTKWRIWKNFRKRKKMESLTCHLLTKENSNLFILLKLFLILPMLLRLLLRLGIFRAVICIATRGEMLDHLLLTYMQLKFWFDRKL